MPKITLSNFREKINDAEQSDDSLNELSDSSDEEDTVTHLLKKYVTITYHKRSPYQLQRNYFLEFQQHMKLKWNMVLEQY